MLFLLLACNANAAQQARFNNEKQLYEQDAAQCTQEAMTRANAVQQRECLNKADVYHTQKAGVTNLGIVYQKDAANLQAAVDYAEGRITAAQYKATVT